MIRTKFVPRVWMGIVVVLAVTGLLIFSALRDAPAREPVDNSRSAAEKPVEYAPPHRMTPDLAVTFVQNEFPGHWIGPGEGYLRDLFRTNCRLLELWQSKQAVEDGMISAGLTDVEASYVLNMSIFSTCPDRG